MKRMPVMLRTSSRMVPTEITPFIPLTLRGKFRELPYSEEGLTDSNFGEEPKTTKISVLPLLHSLILDPRMKVTPARAATVKIEAWNVPVTSIRKPKRTGITSGPMLPSEEVIPTTLAAAVERRFYCQTNERSG
jgi:hypothetical protein